VLQLLLFEDPSEQRNDMSGEETTSEQPAAGWQLKLGIALFVLSIALPLVGVPVVTAMGLSSAMTASVSGGLLVAAEVLGLIAIAVMGKSGYAYIKSRVFGFLKKHGPPQEVSRVRYTIGLVTFSVPILFGWVSPYAGELIPALASIPLPLAIGGDLLLIASLFVLGGNFWDKIRSLFVHDAEVRFSRG
jgi:hypothetical protein